MRIAAEMNTAEWLEDREMRSEYGSATLKYEVAAVLVAARKMCNLTQVELAQMAGVSQAYIAKLESGEANPTLGRLGAILASMWVKADLNIGPLVAPAHRVNTASTSSRPSMHGDWVAAQSTAPDLPAPRILHTFVSAQRETHGHADQAAAISVTNSTSVHYQDDPRQLAGISLHQAPPIFSDLRLDSLVAATSGDRGPVGVGSEGAIHG